MLKPFAELIGTFLFLSVIFYVVTKKITLAPLIIGLTLIGLIFIFGPISGAHFNPAVSILFYLNKSIPLNELIIYIIAQIIGAILAFFVITKKYVI